MLIKLKTLEQAESTQKEYKEGKYKVRITKAIEGVSDLQKTPYLELTFETVEGDIFSIRNRFYLTEKAMSNLLNLLAAIDIYDKDKKEDLNFEPNDLLGALLEVEFVKGEPNKDGKRYLEYKPWSAKAVSGVATPEKDETQEIPF